MTGAAEAFAKMSKVLNSVEVKPPAKPQGDRKPKTGRKEPKPYYIKLTKEKRR